MIDATTIALFQHIAMNQETPDKNFISKTIYFYNKLTNTISTPMNIEKWENHMSANLIIETQNTVFLK